jgi:hypothetical protein
MTSGKTETMQTVVPKPRGGRPAKGRDPLVQVRVPASFVARIDRWAARFEHMDRSVALRCLLNLGLRCADGKPAIVCDPKGSRAHHAKRKDAAPKVPHSHQVEKPPARGRLVLIKGASS